MWRFNIVLCCVFFGDFFVGCVRSFQHIDLNGTSRDYCPHETFEAQCPPGSVIFIVKALYGRMRPGRCISGEYQESMNCWADVTDTLAESCSGRVQCPYVVGLLQATSQPCDKNFNSYLEASYTCIPVEFARACDSPGPNWIELRRHQGFFLPFAETRRPANTDKLCAWKINGQPGQRVNISIQELVKTQERETNCAISVTLSDGSERRSVTLCNEPGTVLFSSETSQVTVEVPTNKHYDGPVRRVFLFQVYGCPDIEPIPGANITRTGNFAETLSIYCYNLRETRYLSCKDGRWQGTPGNCSSLDKSTLTYEEKGLNLSRSPGIATSTLGISLAVVVGVFLGAAIGASMLCVVFCIKRGRRHNTPPRTEVISELSYDTNCSRFQEVAHSNCCTNKRPMHGCAEYTHVWNVHPSIGRSIPEKAYTCHSSTFKPAHKECSTETGSPAFIQDSGTLEWRGDECFNETDSSSAIKNINLSADRTLDTGTKSVNVGKPTNNLEPERLPHRLNNGLGVPFCEYHGNLV